MQKEIKFNKIKFKKSNKYKKESDIVFLMGDCVDTLKSIPEESIKLIITSPPYNLQKEYEEKKTLNEYLDIIRPTLQEFRRILHKEGSICWQVGNFVDKGEIFPLDIIYYDLFKSLDFKLRNRIIWHFNHGLHGKKRLSGRYEVMLWFTKEDTYTFNLDDIRVPSKYPGKTNYKPGPNYGKPSGNPLGKNPSDYWEILIREWELGFWEIPNVKSNHPEKTLHPCSFPIELVERCIFAFTNEGDTILDPYSGVGSSMIAAIMNKRKGIGCEILSEYMDEAKRRVKMLEEGKLPYRPLGQKVHEPTGKEKVSQIPEEWKK
jgi:adenine-specific DNA-methyltransferase